MTVAGVGAGTYYVRAKSAFGIANVVAYDCDVSADGSRFLVNRQVCERDAAMTVHRQLAARTMTPRNEETL